MKTYEQLITERVGKSPIGYAQGQQSYRNGSNLKETVRSLFLRHPSIDVITAIAGAKRRYASEGYHWHLFAGDESKHSVRGSLVFTRAVTLRR